MAGSIHIYLEVGATRTFAGAIEWPGWCRRARTEAEALELLTAYGERYAAAVRAAGATFTPPAGASSFEIVERLKGNAGTDFGAPSLVPTADERPLTSGELARQQALLGAAWDTFDRAARAAVGIELRKGPRGGGRSLEKIVAHVHEADEAYLAQLGAKPPKTDAAALRSAILAALNARARGETPAQPRQTRNPWLPRYFVRRSAWHVLDHAWEIEDRAA